MQAYRVSTLGGEPQVATIDDPSPSDGEVLLKIEACGLNFADLLMAKGTYQDTPEVPFTLGLEVSGTVLAHGDGVETPPIGSRVAVFGGSGGLAELGVFPADMCLQIPDNMSAEVAAGFQVAYGTSHLALTRRANLKSGETLLVLGASGGVGLTAIEVGKALGATVIAVARGPEKLEIARETGADHVIDSDDPELIGKLKALGGVDVVYDPVGGGLFKSAMKACNREARILVIGFASGDVPPVPANVILVKNITVIGFYWGGYLKFNQEALASSMRELLDWYRDGRLRPHVSHVLPLSQADEAMDLLRTRKSTGKVVVTP